jgi:hypothetical protein
MQGEIRMINDPSDFALLAAEGYMFDCEERAGLGVFSPEVKYSERLCSYLEYDKYYGKYDFARLTSGIGTCPAFRKCLREYIKEFNTREIWESSEVKVRLGEDGIFTIEGSDDEILLEIVSYLNIFSFWDEFELIRDYRYIKNPVIFTGLGEEYVGLLEKIDCEALEGREVNLLVASQENFERSVTYQIRYYCLWK